MSEKALMPAKRKRNCEIQGSPGFRDSILGGERSDKVLCLVSKPIESNEPNESIVPVNEAQSDAQRPHTNTHPPTIHVLKVMKG